MCSVQFQIAPCASLHFSIFHLQAPSGVVGVTYRDFNLLHRSLLMQFPLFIWLLFAVSSVPNFRPDTGGRRWTLTRVARSLALRRGAGAAFPVYAAQAPGCSIWSGPCVACGSSFWVPHKSVDSVGPAFCAFPARAAQAARSLPGTLSPLRRAFSPPRPQPQFPPVGCLRLVSVLGSWPLAATLPVDVDHPQSQKSLVRDWKPVCGLVGEAVSGAEFASFPSPLPPGPVLHRLASLWNCSIPLF